MHYSTSKELSERDIKTDLEQPEVIQSALGQPMQTAGKQKRRV